jgi:hypothetical protein
VKNNKTNVPDTPRNRITDLLAGRAIVKGIVLQPCDQINVIREWVRRLESSVRRPSIFSFCLTVFHGRRVHSHEVGRFDVYSTKLCQAARLSILTEQVTATRKKIGVLTFHRCINYGSYWQAKYLVDGLRVRGLDAEILDHRSSRVHAAELRCALQPTLPVRPSRADRKEYRRKTESFIGAISRLPISSPFELDDPAAMDRYDAVVVGSDEVWNLTHPWYGGNRIFYGEGLNADRLVSYAASFGNYPAAWGLNEDYSVLLHRFGLITVRDENSSAIVSAATGREVHVVLDPCLQFAREKTQPTGSSDIAIVYGHNFSEGFTRAIRTWADQRNVRLVSFGYRNDWADEQVLDRGPQDFHEIFEHGRAVITNFFHGCVFAIKNALPFLCEVSPYRSNKVQGLVSTLGCEHRLLSDGFTPPDAASLLDLQLEHTVFERLATMRSASDQLLREALAS